MVIESFRRCKRDFVESNVRCIWRCVVVKYRNRERVESNGNR